MAGGITPDQPSQRHYHCLMLGRHRLLECSHSGSKLRCRAANQGVSGGSDQIAVARCWLAGTGASKDTVLTAAEAATTDAKPLFADDLPAPDESDCKVTLRKVMDHAWCTLSQAHGSQADHSSPARAFLPVLQAKVKSSFPVGSASGVLLVGKLLAQPATCAVPASSCRSTPARLALR